MEQIISTPHLCVDWDLIKRWYWSMVKEDINLHLSMFSVHVDEATQVLTSMRYLLLPSNALKSSETDPPHSTAVMPSPES